MEKNQHNNSNAAGAGLENSTDFKGSQAGQQLPANTSQHQETNKSTAAQNERHSESSFPQQEEETLGTP